jgi:hypothetical protein
VTPARSSTITKPTRPLEARRGIRETRAARCPPLSPASAGAAMVPESRNRRAERGSSSSGTQTLRLPTRSAESGLRYPISGFNVLSSGDERGRVSCELAPPAARRLIPQKPAWFGHFPRNPRYSRPIPPGVIQNCASQFGARAVIAKSVSDEAIQPSFAALDCFASLAMARTSAAERPAAIAEQVERLRRADLWSLR